MCSIDHRITKGYGNAIGKIILTGEHAVVYGQPAIAIPVTEVKTIARVIESDTQGVTIFANDMAAVFTLSDDDNGVTQIVHLCLEALGEDSPNLTIEINSTIPIASGFGSGAAVSAAIARAIFSFYGHDLHSGDLNSLVFETEKIYHLTPSGIDNTVISYEKPVYFIKGIEPDTIHTLTGFEFLIGFTGKASLTKSAVKDVRDAWLQYPQKYDFLFSKIGQISQDARWALEMGNKTQLGFLMNENQVILRQMDLSSPELDSLILAASAAGALGAKLSGGGRGGNMIALVDGETQLKVRDALLDAGAVAVYSTRI